MTTFLCYVMAQQGCSWQQANSLKSVKRIAPKVAELRTADQRSKYQFLLQAPDVD